MNCRCLWTAPDWDNFHPTLLERWIDRSGGRPLTVALDFTKRGSECYRCAQSAVKRTEAVNSLLITTSNRWVSVSLRWPDNLPLRTALNVSRNGEGIVHHLMQSSPPLLESLSLSSSDRTLMPPKLLSGHFPTLQSLHLSHIHMRNVHRAAPALVELHMIQVSFHLDEWTSLISSCRFLTELTLSDVRMIGFEERPTIVEAQLERLIVPYEGAANLFAGIMLPKLSHLTLTTDRWADGTAYPALLHFVSIISYTSEFELMLGPVHRTLLPQVYRISR